MFLAIDYKIFTILNGLAGRSALIDSVLVAFAEYTFFFMFAGVAVYFLIKKRPKIIVEFFLAAFIGRAAVASLVHALFFRIRPFARFTITQLIPFDPLQASFPSGHTVVMAALVWSLLLQKYYKLAALYFILTALSGMSRVAVGVHYPSDIFGGVAAGLLGALAAKYGLKFFYRAV